MMLSIYDEFEQYIFDRVVNKNTKWYFQDDFHEKDFSSLDIISSVNNIYLNINNIADRYSSLQVCYGLQYIIDSSASMMCYAFFDGVIDENERISTLFNMYQVFYSIFNKQCENTLANLSPKNISIYNRLCYMWWDLLPHHGVPRTKENEKIDFAILETIEKILNLKNIACIESALHGLGHWYSGYPTEVERIINSNIDKIPKQLNDYVKCAIRGDVL